MEVIPTIGISVWLFVKIFFIVGLVVYTIFSFVVLRQGKIMTDTVKVGFELPIKIISIIHLLFALSVLLFTIIIL